MEHYINTNKKELNVIAIHDYISNSSYWGRGRSLDEVQITIDNSLCFGLYSEDGTQMGFGRVVSDYLIFAYLMDVIIFEKFQGKGLGKSLVKHIMNHEVLKKVSTIGLKTKDAHGLYEDYGFKKIENSPLWMSIDKMKL
ncbi:MAG: GNAT family N-acetyltransferase [Cellulophaga sp.]